MPKITVRSVDALKPGPKDVWLWDDEIRGFAVRMKPSGTASFILQYRIREGATRRYQIGRVGVLKPDQARDAAREALVKVAQGGDPSAERRTARKSVTLDKAFEEFLKYVEKKRKASTAKGYRWLYNRAIKKPLGTTKPRNLTKGQVKRWHADLSETPFLANRALALLSSFLSWCVEEGHRPDIPSPTRGVERYEEEGRERYLTSDEFGRLGDALRDAEEKAVEPAAALAAIRMLAISGMRLSEVLNLTWDEIARERGFLELTDSKTGKKTIPLTAPMLEILDVIKRTSGNRYVFAGRKAGQPFVGLRRVWERICKTAKIDGCRIHDLRHSAASVGAAGGLSLLMIGKLLGHSQASTTQRYAHLGADPVRSAAEHVAGQIAGMMGGKTAEVVPLKPKTGT